MLNIFRNKKFHKVFSFLSLFLVLSVLLLACSSSSESSSSSSRTSSSNKSEHRGLSYKKIAVVYFSVNDGVEGAAKELAESINADLIELEPQDPYEESDFDENNPNSRRLLESRYSLFEKETEELVDDYPLSYGVEEKEIIEETEPPKATELPKIAYINVNSYDVIFLGYPIWYNDAPRVIYTFFKDLKNKTVIPFTFSTNGESLAASEEIIANYVDDSVDVMGGLEFNGIATESEMKSWISLIDLNI